MEAHLLPWCQRPSPADLGVICPAVRARRRRCGCSRRGRGTRKHQPHHTLARTRRPTRHRSPQRKHTKMSIIIDDAASTAPTARILCGQFVLGDTAARLSGWVPVRHSHFCSCGDVQVRSLARLVWWPTQRRTRHAIEQLDGLRVRQPQIRVRVDRGPTAPKAKKERRRAVAAAPRAVPDEDKVVSRRRCSS